MPEIEVNNFDCLCKIYVHIKHDLNTQILSSKKISIGKLQKNTAHGKYLLLTKN